MRTNQARLALHQQDGYVPNVAYSCGAIVHDGQLLLPYGIADTFTAFATLPLAEVLRSMT